MTVHQHDIPRWTGYTTEALEHYRDRVRAYILTDHSWKVGPAVLALFNAELRARGVE